MSLTRRIAVAAVILLLIAIAWLWWNRVTQTDMAAYAPADSIVYLESRSLTDIATTIGSTEAWMRLSPLLGTSSRWPAPWLVHASGWTGIGPVQSIIAARAQLAVVMLDLGTIEEGETLKIKPEAAVLLETHTGARRIRPIVEQVLKDLAESTYGTPTFKRSVTNGVEFLIWSAPSGQRQIVATVDDSLVIIGNSEAALNACLAVRRGQRTSLRDDAELQQMRRKLAADQALAFGFVSSANAARLAAIAAPLLLGRPASVRGFERLIAGGAAKIVGSIGWSTFASMGGIEDRYLFSLQPSVVARLRPASRPVDNDDQPLALLSDRAYSMSLYRYEDPSAAWQAVESAVLSQLDALSAVVFSSLWKSALLPYGIDAPAEFLKLVGPKLLTVRLTPDAERSVLIAAVRDNEALRRLIVTRLGGSARHESHGPIEMLESRDKDSAFAFINGYLLSGSRTDVQSCAETLARSGLNSNESRARNVKSFQPRVVDATVITYENDTERVRNFITAIARATHSQILSSNSERLELALAELPYSITETSLGNEGLERRTRSSLGQFGVLVALLFPNNR